MCNRLLVRSTLFEGNSIVRRLIKLRFATGWRPDDGCSTIWRAGPYEAAHRSKPPTRMWGDGRMQSMSTGNGDSGDGSGDGEGAGGTYLHAWWIVLCLGLVGPGLVGCQGGGADCQTDGDCPGAQVCTRGGGVLFGEARCVQRRTDVRVLDPGPDGASGPTDGGDVGRTEVSLADTGMDDSSGDSGFVFIDLGLDGRGADDADSGGAEVPADVVEVGMDVAATCSDGIKNGDESDIDCGGTSCVGCSSGESCKANVDCKSKVCGSGGICQAPSCQDGVRNGNENGVDCGGECRRCQADRECTSNRDCMRGEICVDGRCE